MAVPSLQEIINYRTALKRGASSLRETRSKRTYMLCDVIYCHCNYCKTLFRDKNDYILVKDDIIEDENNTRNAADSMQLVTDEHLLLGEAMHARAVDTTTILSV